jgi:hypothetical protein
MATDLQFLAGILGPIQGREIKYQSYRNEPGEEAEKKVAAILYNKTRDDKKIQCGQLMPSETLIGQFERVMRSSRGCNDIGRESARNGPHRGIDKNGCQFTDLLCVAHKKMPEVNFWHSTSECVLLCPRIQRFIILHHQ